MSATAELLVKVMKTVSPSGNSHAAELSCGYAVDSFIGVLEALVKHKGEKRVCIGANADNDPELSHAA